MKRKKQTKTPNLNQDMEGPGEKHMEGMLLEMTQGLRESRAVWKL